jgi:putative FmdB family regulatory protein
MPTYEYACTSCGQRLEVVQSFTDDPLTECPACGGPVKKVFGAVGIVLKGSGFYKTDSRAAARKGGTAGESGSGGDGGAARESTATKESASKPSESAASSGGSGTGDSSPAAAPQKATTG